jgi:hypothetical protein
MRFRRRRRPQSCPLCKDTLDEGLSLHTCPGCKTECHRVCSEELGGCATLGCRFQGGAVSKEAPSGFRVHAERLEAIRAQIRAEREKWAERQLREQPKEEKGPQTLVALAFLLVTVALILGFAFFRDSLEAFFETSLGFGLIIVLVAFSVVSKISGWMGGD